MGQTSAILGSLGVGLMWGWLVGLVLPRSPGAWVAVALATVALGAEVHGFLGDRALVWAGAAMIMSAMSHGLWKRWLRHRYDRGHVRGTL